MTSLMFVPFVWLIQDDLADAGVVTISHHVEEAEGDESVDEEQEEDQHVTVLQHKVDTELISRMKLQEAIASGMAEHRGRIHKKNKAVMTQLSVLHTASSGLAEEFAEVRADITAAAPALGAVGDVADAANSIAESLQSVVDQLDEVFAMLEPHHPQFVRGTTTWHRFAEKNKQRILNPV